MPVSDSDSLAKALAVMAPSDLSSVEEFAAELAVQHKLEVLFEAWRSASLGAASSPVVEPSGKQENGLKIRGRYTLEELYATGGVGRIFLARDKDIGRTVALKELRPERAGLPSSVSRFLREAQITGRLQHPGIAPIYELVRHPDRPFYTMRFIQGRTLSDAVMDYHEKRRRGKAGWWELRDLLTKFVSVCNTLAYAHSQGVIHRDLKPSNVALGDFGEVIVLDWGLAKAIHPDPAELEVVGASDPGLREADKTPLSPDCTVEGTIIGTPAYMAPEQAAGRPDVMDARADIYGLGAILYEILTGVPPFGDLEPQAILDQLGSATPSKPREVVTATPRALEAICLKAMSNRREDRYPTAVELGRDVQRWLADEPVSA